MAKRKIEIHLDIKTELDFVRILRKNQEKLICAEIYNAFAGSCTVLDKVLTVMKLDWSNDQMLVLKVLADDIQCLNRFWYYSEPVHIFILRHKITSVFRGVDQIKFSELARNEIDYYQQAQSGVEDLRPRYDFNEITPAEQEWYDVEVKKRVDVDKDLFTRKAKRQAERKKHRATRLAPHVPQFNFVLFWPNSRHAHPELYQRWDDNNIIMVGREELTLTEEQALDILYEGDAPINEASLHALLSGPALAICFRLLDTDKHFVTLVRRILYEDIPPLEEGKPNRDQPIQKTAYDIYSSLSLSAEQIKQNRRDEKKRAKEDEKYKRERRASEMRRLAIQAKEDAIQLRRAEKEREKLEALKAGNLAALNTSHDDDEEDVDISIVEEIPEEIQEENSEEEEDGDEYFPPAGLFIPGFYSPPNDISKANGLVILFPKIIADYVTPLPEFLPLHVLVLINITKRHKVVPILKKNRTAVIHMGIFQVISVPYKIKHIAYTVKQYDDMDLPNTENILYLWTFDHVGFTNIGMATYNNPTMLVGEYSLILYFVGLLDVKLSVMVSITSDIPLLELMDFNPDHISRDSTFGEDECAAFFPVTYGDDYPQFENFD